MDGVPSGKRTYCGLLRNPAPVGRWFIPCSSHFHPALIPLFTELCVTSSISSQGVQAFVYPRLLWKSLFQYTNQIWAVFHSYVYGTDFAWRIWFDDLTGFDFPLLGVSTVHSVNVLPTPKNVLFILFNVHAMWAPKLYVLVYSPI